MRDRATDDAASIDVEWAGRSSGRIIVRASILAGRRCVGARGLERRTSDHDWISPANLLPRVRGILMTTKPRVGVVGEPWRVGVAPAHSAIPVCSRPCSHDLRGVCSRPRDDDRPLHLWRRCRARHITSTLASINQCCMGRAWLIITTARPRDGSNSHRLRRLSCASGSRQGACCAYCATIGTRSLRAIEKGHRRDAYCCRV